ALAAHEVDLTGETEQRGHRLRRLHPHIAAPPSVATVGPTARAPGLAQERGATSTSGPTLDIDLGAVDEHSPSSVGVCEAHPRSGGARPRSGEDIHRVVHQDRTPFSLRSLACPSSPPGSPPPSSSSTTSRARPSS